MPKEENCFKKRIKRPRAEELGERTGSWRGNAARLLSNACYVMMHSPWNVSHISSDHIVSHCCSKDFDRRRRKPAAMLSMEDGDCTPAGLVQRVWGKFGNLPLQPSVVGCALHRRNSLLFLSSAVTCSRCLPWWDLGENCCKLGLEPFSQNCSSWLLNATACCFFCWLWEYCFQQLSLLVLVMSFQSTAFCLIF